jgi:hypothetical protein
MSTQAMIQQDEQQFQTALDRFKAEAETITVKTAADCLTAKTKQREVRDYMKRVHGALDPFVEDAKSNWQRAKDRLARWLTPAETIDSILAGKVRAYEQAEREAAAAEERRLNEQRRLEAQRKAEEERKERERIAIEERAERERVAAAERKERERAAAAALKSGAIKKAEAERLKKEAAEEAARQKKAAAEAEQLEREQAARDAQAAAAKVEEVRVQPNIPTVAGVPTSSRRWKWRVVDESKIPDQYWILNELKINAEVRADKARTAIPGVEAYQEP